MVVPPLPLMLSYGSIKFMSHIASLFFQKLSNIFIHVLQMPLWT